MSAPTIANQPRIRIFVSYSTADTGLVGALVQHIERDGISCFLAPRNISPPPSWEPILEDQISRADLFLLVYTADAGESSYVQAEVDKAAKAKKEIWTIQEPAAKITKFFKDRDFMHRHSFHLYRGEEAECFADVLNEIQRVWPAPAHFSISVLRDNCPYPGPIPFRAGSEDIFFGRRTALNRLQIAIEGKKRVLLVYGPSGVGKTSLLTVGLKGVLPDNCFYPKPIEGVTAVDLIRGLLKEWPGQTVAPSSHAHEEEAVNRILSLIERGRSNRYVLCFDQMENLFTGNPREIDAFLEALGTILKGSQRPVTILISFRKESLSEVQEHVNKYFPGNWDGLILSKLSSDEAEQCMIEPAARRNVAFDPELVRALVKTLEKDPDTSGAAVNPMDIQKVCVSLWRQVAELAEADKTPKWRLDGHTLARLVNTGGDLQSNANRFVENVLRTFLREKIEEISKSLSLHVVAPDPQAYVELSLLAFVGPANERLRLQETRPNRGQPCVGRLEWSVVKELVASGLLQRCGEKEYELAHDALALEIAKHSEIWDTAFAVKSLNAVLTREVSAQKAAQIGFNCHAELLAKLEPVRQSNWPLQAAEAEFLVRCALGNRPRNISLSTWAGMLSKKSPGRLLQVFKDGLADASEQVVQLDVLRLLCQPAIGDAIADDLEPIGARLTELCLHSKSLEVRANACSALAALGYEPGIAGLFTALNEPRSHADARTAIAFVRHAFDMTAEPSRLRKEEEPVEDARQLFQLHWNSFGFWNQLTVFLCLLNWRWRRAYRWILYIVGITAPLTALGAILPFIPLEHFGASLAPENSGSGMAVGGIVWGLGASLSVLLYSIIWRGGLIREGMRDATGMMLCASLGGALAGLLNSVAITFVSVFSRLYEAGWLTSENPITSERLQQVFLWSGTRHGWIAPLFGAALGLGIGWSLARILGDSRERWIASNAPLAHGQTGKTLLAITRRVLRECWRNALWIGIGALAVYFIIRPGEGVCDPGAAHGPLGFSTDCALDPLPPKWARTTGLAVILLCGSLAQEIGLLFSLLSVKLGVTLEENRGFLRAAGAQHTP